MNSKERCLAVIDGARVDRVPVFPLLMFFAQKRAGISYRRFAADGCALADAQLGMLERFPVDALTVCSDAFRLTADLGAEMAFPDEQPPYAVRPAIRSEAELRGLRRPDPLCPGSRMADRVLGARLLAEAIGGQCLVLGWVDMPFAEACSVCGVSEFLMMLVDNPPLAHRVLELLTGIVIDFALAQLATGAPMIGAGDAAASLISPSQYRQFALPYERRVVDAIHQAGGLVKLHICGNTTHLLNDMLGCGADLFNVDHLVDFEAACEVFGGANRCFKGNLNPVADLLQATPQRCAERSRELLTKATGRRYMLSAGCEVPPDTPDEVFRTFCEVPAEYARTRPGE